MAPIYSQAHTQRDNVLTVLGAAYVVITIAMMHFVTLRDEGGLNVIGVVLNAWLG